MQRIFFNWAMLVCTGLLWLTSCGRGSSPHKTGRGGGAGHGGQGGGGDGSGVKQLTINDFLDSYSADLGILNNEKVTLLFDIRLNDDAGKPLNKDSALKKPDGTYSTDDTPTSLMSACKIAPTGLVC